jgi:hypothetical protein
VDPVRDYYSVLSQGSKESFRATMADNARRTTRERKQRSLFTFDEVPTKSRQKKYVGDDNDMEGDDDERDEDQDESESEASEPGDDVRILRHPNHQRKGPAKLIKHSQASGSAKKAKIPTDSYIFGRSASYFAVVSINAAPLQTLL